MLELVEDIRIVITFYVFRKLSRGTEDKTEVLNWTYRNDNYNIYDEGYTG